MQKGGFTQGIHASCTVILVEQTPILKLTVDIKCSSASRKSTRTGANGRDEKWHHQSRDKQR